MTKAKGKKKKKPRRKYVLFEPYDQVVAKVKADPGEWYLVGGDDLDRLGTISQTAYRIRHGLITTFASPAGGAFEVKVSTDKSLEDREHPVELYLRWVPIKVAA